MYNRPAALGKGTGFVIPLIWQSPLTFTGHYTSQPSLQQVGTILGSTTTKISPQPFKLSVVPVYDIHFIIGCMVATNIPDDPLSQYISLTYDIRSLDVNGNEIQSLIEPSGWPNWIDEYFLPEIASCNYPPGTITSTTPICGFKFLCAGTAAYGSGGTGYVTLPPVSYLYQNPN